MIRLWAASALLVMASSVAGGQDTQSRGWIQQLLPSGARVTDVADVDAGRGKSRALVLWMLIRRPTKLALAPDLSGCSAFGHEVESFALARLSLVDLSQHALINTIKIDGKYEGAHAPQRASPTPLLVSNHYGIVPHSAESEEQKSMMLRLSDMTGEGISGQFVLVAYPPCGDALTAVFGYSRRTDTAVQFPVEVHMPGKRPQIRFWVAHTFGAGPGSSGNWNFTRVAAHDDPNLDENVSFDAARQLFVERITFRPIPATTTPKGAAKGQRKP